MQKNYSVYHDFTIYVTTKASKCPTKLDLAKYLPDDIETCHQGKSLMSLDNERVTIQSIVNYQ